MGLPLSWWEILRQNFFGLAYNISFIPEPAGPVNFKSDSFKKSVGQTQTMTNSVKSNTRISRKNSINLKKCKPENVKLDKTLSFKQWQFQDSNHSDSDANKPIPAISLPEPALLFLHRPFSELDKAAVKLQKVYKSYRTRRNLADCAVVIEELWWKALDFAALKRSSVSFFSEQKPETAVSKWARAGTRAAKVGKGLSKDEKAQKLALQHWLEAIDPRHRYGHNLHLYYDVWFKSESTQPFFYWLDVGDGKEVNLEKCPRIVLQRQCIKYLGPKERKAYEVVIENGQLVYWQSREPVNTIEGSKWIFVLSTARALYVGQKRKGMFQHSSFLAGGATTSAGRLVARNGFLEAIWPYSGHYHPTEENFREFVSFLEENHVDLTNVKRCAIDEDRPSYVEGEEKQKSESTTTPDDSVLQSDGPNTIAVADPMEEASTIPAVDQEENANVEGRAREYTYNLTQRLSRKWTTGAGPRIGCVREYPMELQSRALEQVNLSPRTAACGTFANYGPIPSPRPSPNVRLSPRLAHMGLSSALDSNNKAF